MEVKSDEMRVLYLVIMAPVTRVNHPLAFPSSFTGSLVTMGGWFLSDHLYCPLMVETSYRASYRNECIVSGLLFHVQERFFKKTI